jgi:hypothetical protein
MDKEQLALLLIKQDPRNLTVATALELAAKIIKQKG